MKKIKLHSPIKIQEKKKVVSRRVIREPKKPVLTIKKFEPAEYKRRFFKESWEHEKENLFFT